MLKIKSLSEGLIIHEKFYMEGDPWNTPKWFNFGPHNINKLSPQKINN